MRDFLLETQQILGWFDGRTANFLEAGYSPHVHFHESTHARIFNETPDGGLLRLLILLHNTSQNKLFDDLGGVIRHLIETSRSAHEIAATYIGIKYLGTEYERRIATDALSDEYSAYYRYFSDLLDPIGDSTNLQSALAWSATCLIFSSTLMKEFVDSGFDFERLRTTSVTPNNRAAALQSWFKDGALQAALEFAYEQYRRSLLDHERVPPSLDDLKTEAFFGRISRQDVVHVEGIILSQSYLWLIDNCPLPSIDSSSDELRGCVEKIGAFLAGEISVVIGTREVPHIESGHSIGELQNLASIELAAANHIEPRLGDGSEFPELTGLAEFESIGCKMLQLCFAQTDPAAGQAYVMARRSRPRHRIASNGTNFTTACRCVPSGDAGSTWPSTF